MIPLPPPTWHSESRKPKQNNGAWSSEITQGCRGFVRVSYSAPGGLYQFDYDVPQHRIHPGNAAAERILARLPVAADGGVPH